MFVYLPRGDEGAARDNSKSYLHELKRAHARVCPNPAGANGVNGLTVLKNRTRYVWKWKQSETSFSRMSHCVCVSMCASVGVTGCQGWEVSGAQISSDLLALPSLFHCGLICLWEDTWRKQYTPLPPHTPFFEPKQPQDPRTPAHWRNADVTRGRWHLDGSGFASYCT